MHSIVKSALPIFLLTIVVSSGCVNIDPQALAMANPMIQEFLEEHPNAQIVVTRLTQEQMEPYVDDIRSECGNTAFQAKDMYRVTINDPDSDFRATVWVDWEEQIVECAIKYGTETEVNRPPKPGCTSHATYKCYSGQIYWYDSCGLLEEVKQYCRNGCENRNCKSETSCISHHEQRCYGNDVYWYNSCGNKEEKKEYCEFGCEGKACVEVVHECTDSDGGLEYFEKGTTALGTLSKTDSCYATGASAKGVIEYYCENNEIKSIEHECSPVDLGDGTTVRCQYGACIENADDYIVDKDCTDSDGGKDYYVAGVLTDNKGYEYEDYCTNENPTVNLHERFCAADGTKASIGYLCPNGCEDGACLESEECTSHTEARCYDNDLYWYDSCGTKEEKKEECEHGCEQGSCIGLVVEISLISEGEGVLYQPDIYGNKVVWADRYGNSDIYMYDINTETEEKITNDEHYQGLPKIHGNYIVWKDGRERSNDLYLYNIETEQETCITKNTSEKYWPTVWDDYLFNSYAIHGNYVVYIAESYYNESGNYVSKAMYVYNIGTGETEKIISGLAFNRVDVYGDKIVYKIENEEMFQHDLHIYDISTQVDEILDAGYIASPSIFDNRIVYSKKRYDEVDGYDDVYIYDIDTGSSDVLIYDFLDQEYPNIYGDYVIWTQQDDENGIDLTNIHVYDIETGLREKVTDQNTVNPGYDSCWYGRFDNPNIYENKIVFVCNDKVYIAEVI